MMTAEMTTFKEWKTKKTRNKRFIIAACAIVGGYALLCAALKPYFASTPDCGQPCPEGKGCEPLGYSFDAKAAPKIPGVPGGIWYKAALTNRSCLKVYHLSVSSVYDSDRMTDGKFEFWMRLEDSKGKTVRRQPNRTPDGGMAWDFGKAKGSESFATGTVHPYYLDTRKLGEMMDEGRLEDGRTTLLPGESIATIPSVLSPYKLIAKASSLPGGGIADGIGPMPIENSKAFPTPPVGFSWLEGYDLPPGRYTVRNGYTGGYLTQTSNPRWDRIPSWLKFVLSAAKPRVEFNDRAVDIRGTDVTIEVTK